MARNRGQTDVHKAAESLRKVAALTVGLPEDPLTHFGYTFMPAAQAEQIGVA